MNYLIEFNNITNMRKIDALKDVPLGKWNKNELLDYIDHYMVYFEKNRNNDNLLNIDEFLKYGMYKRYYNKDIEELKKL